MTIKIKMMRKFKPLKLKYANMFISQYHRHSSPLRLGGEIAIGLYENNELIGVGILGRPVARHLCDGKTIEIRRTCVKEGYKNANSQLYGRLCKIAQLRIAASPTLYSQTDIPFIEICKKTKNTLSLDKWI